MHTPIDALTLEDFFTAFENSYNAIVITTPYLEAPHPQFLYVNSAFTRMTGYTLDELKGQSPRILQGEQTDHDTLARLKVTLQKGEFFEGSTVNYTKEGKPYYVEWNISPIYDSNHQLRYYLSIQRNISDSVERNLQEEIFRLSIDQSVEHIALIDASGHYSYINDAYSKRTGYTKEQMLGQNPRILKSDKHDGEFYKLLYKKLNQKKPFEEIFINKNSDGHLYYDKQTITPILAQGRIIKYLVVGRAVSLDEGATAYYKNLALKDALTGAYNRHAFEIVSLSIMEAFLNEGKEFSVVMLDIDHFKKLNDTYGHSVGDMVLEEIASRLQSSIRNSDYLFRWGGEEFLVILSTSMPYALKVTQTLRERITSKPFCHDLHVTASFGVAALNSYDLHAAIEAADKALYRAKNSGRDTICEA
ncbi:MAG: hypothetical protein KU37_06430 [Sulfuricurvum sp. PC08-66]|nr:MAG: hypothetical protein KU37_06430 [Sulfuricurvum sp. PC08-66]